MSDRETLLAAYDDQLRTDAETPSALEVRTLGPLRLVRFPGERGFVTYPHLAGADGERVAGLVGEALATLSADPDVTSIEWKTRGHDHAPGLHEALLAHGFEPQESEAVMIGEASSVAADVPVPDGVRLRRVTAEADVRAMTAMQDVAFGDRVSQAQAEAVLHRLALDDGMQLWVAEHGGEIVGAGRLEPVAGTEVAGVWGGAVLRQWRGRGIYRALTAVRAQEAVRLGRRLLHSDSTPMSQPILERSGMVAVTSTTPYEWLRGSGD